MANYELPQVRVFQDLEASIEPSERLMLPAIIGQRRDIFDYDVLAETGKLGDYTMSADLLADWDGLGPNSTVIQNTVRIYGEDLKVSLVKAGFVDDIKCLSTLRDVFNPVDYFTPVVEKQKNALVFRKSTDYDVEPPVAAVIPEPTLLPTWTTENCTPTEGEAAGIPGCILKLPSDTYQIMEIPLAVGSLPVHELDNAAFAGNSVVTQIQFPITRGVDISHIVLNDRCFDGCISLTDVNLQPTLQTIPAAAFRGCTSLTSIIIPSPVYIIGNQAFAGCTGLKKIYFLGSVLPSTTSDVFNNVHEDAIIYLSENYLGPTITEFFGIPVVAAGVPALEQSINLSGPALYRTPEVGDFVKVRQTSQDTIGQKKDWTAQVIGLIETEKARVNQGVGTPAEPVVYGDEVRLNTFDTRTDLHTETLEATKVVSGDEHLGVTYRIVPLQDIAYHNSASWLAKYQEIGLNKACENGIFNLQDLGYSVRVDNVTDVALDLIIQSKNGNTPLRDIPINSFVKCSTSDTDSLWFDEEGNRLDAEGDEFEDDYTASDPVSLIGQIVDEMFLVYAVPLYSGDVTAAERDGTTGTTTITSAGHGVEKGSYIVVEGFNNGMEGRFKVDSVTSNTITYTNPGVTIPSSSTTGATFYTCPVKNDSFELSGALERPPQEYDGQTDVPALTVDAKFDSVVDTIYTIEVIEGGAQDCSANGLDNHYPAISLRVSTNNALDSVEIHNPVINWDPKEVNGLVENPGVDVGATKPIRIGTKGVEIEFKPTLHGAAEEFNLIAFSKGDIWTIDCTGRSGDQVVGVITDKNFDYFRADIETQRLDVEFMEELRGATEIPRLQTDSIENWEINPDPVDGVDYDLRFLSGAQVRVDDIAEDLTISDGRIFMTYEAVNNSNTGSVIRVLDASDPNDELGPDDPRNPLGYGVRKTLLNSRGLPALVVPVDKMDDEDVSDALALLSQNNNTYQIVPMTFDESIQNKVIAHTLAMSTETMDLWRRAYICTDIGHEYGIVTVDATNTQVTGTFEQNGDKFNKLVLDDSNVGVSFLQSKVKAGHIVRFNYSKDMYGDTTYSEFAVLSVLNATELLILGDYGSPSATMDICIYKDTKAEDIIYEVGNRSEGLNSRRVTNVYPSILVDENEQAVPGYFGAAALAGLAAGSEPHQGHTNSKLLGFSEASTMAPMRRMDVFSMNELAGKGVTIITGEASNIGIRHELTTAMIDRKNRETMVTRNLDSIAYTYFDALSPFIGIANVTPEFVNKVRTELASIGNYIIASTKRPLIGSQMTSYEINKVEQDLVLSDKINIYITPILPLPFNYGDIHLQI